MRWFKIEKIVDEHNKFVESKIADLKVYQNEIDPYFVSDCVVLFEHSCKINKNTMELRFICDGVSKKEINELVDEKVLLTEKMLKKTVSDFEFIKKKVKENKYDFCDFVNHFCPGFYTLTDISSNKRHYMYAVELEEMSDSDDSIKLYGLLSNIKNSTNTGCGYKIYVNYKNTVITKMTWNEFKQYLFDRVSCCEINNEMKLDDYMKKLTEKFNNWDKSIV